MAGKSVWVVEQGEYSDYRVVGVFSTRANAQMVADKVSRPGAYEQATVSEWPLDPFIDEVCSGRKQFYVCMAKDGTTRACREINPPHHSGNLNRAGIGTTADVIKTGNGTDASSSALIALVWAKDEKHAIKITNEHRTRMIATGEWDKQLELRNA